MTNDELNKIEARANKAPASISDDLRDISKCWDILSDKGKHALIFLIDAHKDVLALIAEVRQLRAERDVLVNVLAEEHLASCPGGMDECTNPYNISHKECIPKVCWLEWARMEVEKAVTS